MLTFLSSQNITGNCEGTYFLRCHCSHSCFELNYTTVSRARDDELSNGHGFESSVGQQALGEYFSLSTRVKILARNSETPKWTRALIGGKKVVVARGSLHPSSRKSRDERMTVVISGVRRTCVHGHLRVQSMAGRIQPSICTQKVRGAADIVGATG